MRESNPILVAGSLSWLLAPVEQTTLLNEPASNASLPASRSEAVLSQTLYNQGASLNKISNTVEELHDTMSDLKQSFRALQLELNTTPSARNSEYHGDEAMEMLRTVLKELQHKSDEIEKLKLENESLKLKAKYWQGRPMGGAPTTPRVLEHAMPEVQSPGFLNDSGKRGLISGSTQLQITHSFDQEHGHTEMEHTASSEVVQYETAPVKVPLKPVAEILPKAQRLLQREDGVGATTSSRRRRESGEPAMKRPRLTLNEDPESSESNVEVESNPPPKKRGRPSSRKSLQATMRTPQTHSMSNPASSTNADADTELRTTEDRSVDAPDKTDTQPRRKSRKGRTRTITSRSTSQPASRPPSLSPRVTRGGTKLNDEDTPAATKPTDKPSLENELPNRPTGFEIAVNVAELTPESVVNEDYLFARIQQKEDQSGKNSEANEQRQAKVAAREMIVKAAMEREEAMADG